MDLMKIVTNVLADKLGVDGDTVQSVVEQLMGNGDGGIDVAGLVSSFNAGGLSSAVSSWLGDGANDGLDISDVVNALGSDKLASVASQFNLDVDQLAGGLAEAVPSVIDNASSGGNLLDAVGGIGGLADMAKKFF
ncbi:MAG: hypothetical protein HWE20_05730 [Gammaproteobacteria bacterium]|nr:hypothetical protein [Gammaproteobacteria bacterium]